MSVKVVIFCLCDKFRSSVNNHNFTVMFLAFFHAERSLVLPTLFTQDRSEQIYQTQKTYKHVATKVN